MRMHYHVMSAPAPLRLLFLGANDQGLQVVEYMDRRSLKRTLADHTRPGAEWEASLHGLRPLADQMDEYFTGARRVFEWPLAPVSSPLQLLVMRAIRRIPYGTTLTVVELAKHIGQPKAVKDVTQAVLTNPLALVVPCHRVVGPDGKPLDGAGGVMRRRALLDVEQRFARMGGLDDNRVIGELVKRVAAAPAASPARTARTPVKRTTKVTRRTPAVAARATGKTRVRASGATATVRASAKKRSR